MNVKIVALVLGLAVVGLAGPASASTAQSPVADTREATVARAIDGAIRPGYAAFSAEATSMRDSGTELCAEPSQASLDAARRQFASLVAAFSRIEFVRFGPVMDDNRIERILFWPDRKGLGLKQVQAILAANDETATSVDSLHGKSVAVQGLGALEFVLFGTGAESLTGPGGAFRCRFGAAIAGNLEAMAGNIARGWQSDEGIAHALLHPAPAHPAYRSIDDSLQEIVGVFIHGFEAMRDLRLKPPLGANLEAANPNGWIYRRSGATTTGLRGDFAGLKSLFEALKLDDLLPADARWAPPSIAFEFSNAERTLAALDTPLDLAVKDATAYQRLGYLVILTTSLQTQFATQIATPLGLSAGFSALDGD